MRFAYVSRLSATAVLLGTIGVAPATASAAAPSFSLVAPDGTPVVNATITVARYLNGDKDGEQVLATVPVGLDGSYVVPAGLLKAPGLNLEIRAVSNVDGRLLFEEAFPSQVPTALRSTVHGSPAVIAAVTSKRLRRGTRPLATTSTCPGGAGGGWVTVYTENHTAIVGEPHAHYDDTVNFAYLSDNTTSLGVGYTYDAGATWTASGSVSVDKSSSASSMVQTDPRGPYWAAYEMAEFRFDHQHWINSCGEYRGEVRVVARAWTGGMAQGASTGQFDGTGTSIYSRALANGWRQPEQANTTYTKTTGHASGYSTGLNLGPLQVSSSTSHNTEVTYSWHFGSATTHYLMGSDNVVSAASIVYSY